MAKQITLEQYLTMLREVIGDEYKVGTWHPEDLGVAIESASETMWKVLNLI
jgi:hypothetical protein